MNSGSRTTFVIIMLWLWTAVCGAVLSLAGVFLYLNPQIPPAASYRHVRLETPLRIYADNGELLAEFGERRVIPVTLQQIPPLFVHALLDTEDKRFYSHNGIDFISLINDTWSLVVNRGEIRSGASTITMQLARNISFTLERTFIRKFKEMLLALKLERELSKDEILELYFNVAPFGKRAYGAQAAAYTYYGRPLDQLDLAELAMLAGIPQAPTAGNPINGPERAMKRRNLVLSRMFDQGTITQAQYDAAVAEPNTASLHETELALSAPYPAEWARQQLVERYGKDVYSNGYTVTTTIAPKLQRAAIGAIQNGLFRYDRRHGYRGPIGHIELPGEGDGPDVVAAAQNTLTSQPPRDGLEAAVVVAVDGDRFSAVRGDGATVVVAQPQFAWARPLIDANTRGAAPAKAADVVTRGDVIWLKHSEDGWALSQLPDIQGALIAMRPDNGAVKALVGGFDFALNQYNHALQGARQPGSGFKPFVYSAALANGITPASVFMDAPLVFHDANLETTYRPKNDGARYNGPTRLREALYRSINLVSMRVLLAVGANNVIDYVKRFGFDTSGFPHNTQLAIGGGTMALSPVDMARAYAVFANGGYLVNPHIVTEVRDMSGAVIFKPNYPVVCDTCDSAPAQPAVATRNEPESTASSTQPATTDANQTSAAAPDEATDATEDEIIPAPRVLDPRIAFIMHTMLEDVIRRGTAVRARSLNRSDLAGKTGTTNEADTWFNGYQQSLVADVWVGFSDHRPVGDNEYGSNLPLPIWIDFMKVALDGVPEQHRVQPPGVVTMKIDPRTGQPAPPDQSDAMFEYFLAEHAPKPLTTRQPGTETVDTTPVRPVDIF
jgi:penicillin-binding protein 1A